MVMKKSLPIRRTLRFRRWSRKRYAAFASMGRCVTIGCLRKNVADCSLSKQKQGTVRLGRRNEEETLYMDMMNPDNLLTERYDHSRTERESDGRSRHPRRRGVMAGHPTR